MTNLSRGIVKKRRGHERTPEPGALNLCCIGLRDIATLYGRRPLSTRRYSYGASGVEMIGAVSETKQVSALSGCLAPSSRWWMIFVG